MKAIFKTCGAIFLVSGTCIGAGMLALPIVTVKCGFGWSVVLFIGCWLVMLLSSLLVLEVNYINLEVQMNTVLIIKIVIGVM